MSLADLLHKIVDGLGVHADKDALHAEVDAETAEPEPAPEPAPAPETPPDPDTPAPVFGTESEPHGAE